MYHYNAFISYNHNPRDVKIASLLQNQLENYKIPKDVKSSTELSKIERVFLDKGELEVAGDLNEIICDALENTDWLIVICSPESRKSIWVQREIEYFLRNHTLDRILTVITDGEPFDVLPEILLKENREPLSCDYRQLTRAARNVELPRLVAALIGCKYDDLVQRQRHYRMRRLRIISTVAAVVLLSAITYLIWSNNQIRKNLETSQIEQSLNLSLQSEQALDAGDRISALQYAIDALPSEEKDRPVVPEAVLSLSRAMNIYKAVNTGSLSAVRRYPSYGLRHIKLTTAIVNGRGFIVELFSNGRFALWDLDTGKELMKEYSAGLAEEGTRVQNLAFSDNGNLVIITANNIRILDLLKETELKTISFEGEYFKIYDYNEYKTKCDDPVILDNTLWIPIATIPDAKTYSDLTVRHNSLAVLEQISAFARDSTEVDELVLYNKIKSDSDINFRIAKIDLDSGKETAEISAPRRPTKLKLSLDGKYLAGCYSDFYERKEEQDGDKLVVMKADDLRKVGTIKTAFASDFRFDDRNRLIVCGFDKMPEIGDPAVWLRVDYFSNAERSIFTFSKDRNIVLHCFDIDSCDEVWERKVDLNTGGIPWLRLTDENSMLNKAILCNVGNTILITDPDGKEIERLTSLSTIVEEDCAENYLIVILDDGRTSQWRYDEEHKLYTITQSNDVLAPIIDYREVGGYTLALSTDSGSNSFKETLTQYNFKGIDSKLEALEYDEAAYADKGTMTFIDAGYYGDYFIEIRRGESGNEILVRDNGSGKIHETYDVSAEYLYSGIDRSRGKVYFLKKDDYVKWTLLSVDLESGEEAKVPLKMINAGAEMGENQLLPNIYDILKPVDLYSDYVGMAGIFSFDSKYLYYAAMESVGNEQQNDYLTHLTILTVDPETGETEVSSIRDPEADFDNIIYNNVRINSSCRRLVLLENSMFTSYDFNGKVLWSGDPLSYEPSGFTCADDGTVIALEKDGPEAVFHIYSSRDGKETAVSELGAVHMLSHEKMECLDLSDEEKLVAAGDDAYLVDSKTWELRTAISDNYVTYSPEDRQFILGNADERYTGRAPYRTLEEMITEAREVLSD